MTADAETWDDARKRLEERILGFIGAEQADDLRPAVVAMLEEAATFQPPPTEVRPARREEYHPVGLTDPGAALRNGREWHAQMSQLDAIVRTGFLPDGVDTPQKAWVIISMGKQLGIDHMTALREIYVVNGRPEISGALTLHLIERDHPNHEWHWDVMTAEVCEVRCRRSRDRPFFNARFTKAEAEAAGLLSKKGNVWKNYTADMLRWRCTSRARRFEFPSVATGFYVRGEIEDSIAVEAEEKAAASVTQLSQPSIEDLL